MRGITVFSLFTWLTQRPSDSKEIVTKQLAQANDLTGQLVNDLVDRMLDSRLKRWPLESAQQANTTLGKLGHRVPLASQRNLPARWSVAEIPVVAEDQQTNNNAVAQPDVWKLEGKNAQAWLLGTMHVSHPDADALRNHPSLTTHWNNPAVKGVLTLNDRFSQIRLLNATGEAFRGMGDQIKKYGMAGFVSLVVESVLYWVFILIPAAAYMYHTNAGTADAPWLPTMSDPDSVKEFGKLLGGAYLFSKIPPIEAARWAWALAMVPWFENHLQPPVLGNEQLPSIEVADRLE